jgi:HEAT repeat protein
MKKSVTNILLGVLTAAVIFVAVIFVLSKSLGNMQIPPMYGGKPMEYWQQQLYGRDAAASNTAFAVISAQVFPQLEDAMFHDTHDSALRVWAVNALNNLPGVQIDYTEADARRAAAAASLGDFGPAAKSAVPELIKALKGGDALVRVSVVTALGKIHANPETVIPLLIPYLEDDGLDVAAAYALAEYGNLAKAAVPKLLPLLNAKDDDDQAAAKAALLKIDPEAAAKAGVKSIKK